MSKKEKLIEKLLDLKRSFHYRELKTLLESLGYIEDTKGNTSGSRVVFINNESDDKDVIHIHKPHHSGNELKDYARKDVINYLKKRGIIE